MDKALSDLTILDFSHLLQGPFCTQLLGDMGADIIKIERPGQGDLFRTMTFEDQWVGGTQSPNYLAWNRNKRSIALDLKSDAARQIIYRLAESADVAIQNFRPGVMERLGFGYRQLSAINPRMIYANASGYGEDGPYATRPGQDMLIQGLTGILTSTGRADQPPTPVGAGFSDQVGAMNLVYGILTALYWRERSGRGQEVSVNLLAGMMAHQNQEYLTAMAFGRDLKRPRSGIGHPGMAAPFGVYPTEDGWITIAMSPFCKLVAVLGDDALLRYDDPVTLFNKRDEVWEAVAALTAGWRRFALLEKLLEADIWCGEVKSHLEAASDPQVEHLKAITSYRHPTVGEVRVVAPAVRMSQTPASIDRHAPLLGEHTVEILQQAGFADNEIDGWLKCGAVAQDVTVGGSS